MVFGNSERFLTAGKSLGAYSLTSHRMISFQHFHHVKFQLHKQKQIFRHQQNFFSVESEEYAIQKRQVTVCDARNTFNNVLEVFFICY